MIKPRTDKLNALQEMKTEKRRILAFRKEGGFLFFVVRSRRLERFGEEESGTVRIGDVYLGKVSKVAANIQGVFVEVQKKVFCFLSGEEEAGAKILNRPCGGGIRPGDELLVRIKKSAYKTKLAVCTSKFPDTPETQQLFEAAAHALPFCCLKKQPGELQQYLDLNPLTEGELIVTEDAKLYEELKACLPFGPDKIKLYQDEQLRLPALYSVQKMLDEVTQKKVWLKSGGFLVIEPTEAMTVIDVNSGKNQKGTDRENTILACNLEALEEIVLQTAARNLSGILVIDFISMKSEEHKTILQNACRESFLRITPPLQYVEYTKLGLVEATRKKETIDIYEFFTKNDKTILL